MIRIVMGVIAADSTYLELLNRNLSTSVHSVKNCVKSEESRSSNAMALIGNTRPELRTGG